MNTSAAAQTLIPFTPSTTDAPPFSALVILDGASYTLAAAWNFYGQRWYISLTDQSGNLILNQPLVGSSPNANIYLAPGMFTSSTLLYRVGTNNFEIMS
jgi:hypothetical protein